MTWHYRVGRGTEHEWHTVSAMSRLQAQVAAAEQWTGTGWLVDYDSFEVKA